MKPPADFRVDVQAYQGAELVASINPEGEPFRQYLADVLPEGLEVDAVLEAIKGAAWQTNQHFRLSPP